MSFEPKNKEDCTDKEWKEHIKEWRRLNEEGYFKRQSQEFLKNRTFEKIENINKDLILSHKDLKEGIPLFKLFYMSGLADSNSDARRLIKQGGAYVNSQRIQDANFTINSKYLIAGEIILRAGKKEMKKVLVR